MSHEIRIGAAGFTVIGLLIRESFSFWTGHPFDFELWVRVGYWVAHGADPYGVLRPAPGLSFANLFTKEDNATIAYLPFWPIVTAGIYLLYAFIGFQNRFFFYFLLKQPIIAGDVLAGVLLYTFVRERRPEKAHWTLVYWLFSPLNIILSSLWGMFDSLAMLVVLIGLSSGGQTARSIWSGIATFVKSIPVIYAIPLVLSGKNKPRNLLLAVLLPTLLSLGIIELFGWPLARVVNTLSSTVAKNGESLSVENLLLYLRSIGMIPSSYLSILNLLGYLWIPAVLIASLVAYRKFGFTDDKGIVQSLLFCTLIFLVFRLQVNEQYTVYFFALSVLDVLLWNPRRKLLLLLQLGVVTSVIFVNYPLLVRFISPSFPNALDTEILIRVAYLQLTILAKVVLGTLFTSFAIVYLAHMLRRR